MDSDNDYRPTAIGIHFNSDMLTSEPSDRANIFSVGIHELLHGLGFSKNFMANW